MNIEKDSAQSVFAEAVENWSPERWPDFIQSACQGDATLAAQVSRLLDAHLSLLRGPSFMERTAFEAVAGAVSIATDELLGSTIDRYKLLEQIGEGGMGIVYLAEQLDPVRRLVALKIVKLGADTRQVVARFDAERQALAMMDHPNIAKILDGGVTNLGRPYFVMELVRGMPITQYCDHAQLDMRSRLERFVTICHAVQHAHQRGIIHRDIKPSNVLMTVHDGVAVPKIIDFGIAKAIGHQLTDHSFQTATIQMVGTPLYMSPEQAQLGACDVDIRSDVYSLGVLLYSLLAGRHPIERDSSRNMGLDELRRIIREDEPPSPSRSIKTGDAATLATIADRRAVNQSHLHRLLRGELDWIVMKALEKDPDRRYQSVGEFSADIQRYLENKPIQARPATVTLRIRKWCRRHPVQAVSLAAVILLFVSLLAGSYWHSRRLGEMLATANELRETIQNRETLLRHELYATDMTMAWQAAMRKEYTDSRRLLDRYASKTGQSGDVGFEWHYLRGLSDGRIQTFRHESDLLTADVSPDSELLASGDRGGTVAVWNLVSSRVVKSWSYDTKEITCVRFSPDGRFLATAGQDQTIRLWRVDDWTEVAKFSGHTRTVCCVAWSPDSRRLVSGGRDHWVHVWDVASNKLDHSLPEHADVVRAVAWSSDGQFIATTEGNYLHLWNAADSTKRGAKFEQSKGVLAVAFSPDSKLVAFGGYSGSLSLVSVEKMEELARTEMPMIWSLAFAANDQIAVGTSEGVIVYGFDASEGSLEILRDKLEVGGTVRGVCPYRHGTMLVTAAEESRVLTTWDYGGLLGKTIRTDRRHAVGVLAAPDVMVTYDEANEGSVHLVGMTDGKLRAKLPFYQTFDCLPCLSPRGDLLAFPRNDGHLWLYDTETWQYRQELSLPRLAVIQMAFSSDGQWLAAGCLHGLAGAWNLATGEWRDLWDGKKKVFGEIGIVACSPVEPIIIVGVVGEPSIRIMRFGSDEALTEFASTSGIHDLKISPDGKILAAAEKNQSISLWDISSRRPLGKFIGHEQTLTSLAFSPDGKTLASSEAGGSIRLWNMATQRELFTLFQLPTQPRWMGFISAKRFAIVPHQPGDRVLIFGSE